jgi:ABC-type oligopeptide transport system ATPase subunit
MLGLSYLLLSHDLTTVEHMSDWLGMMYLVKLVEFVYPCMPPWAVCTFAES